MNLNNVDLMLSAVSKRQYPNTNLPEIAFAGRSNVGKSSLINKLLNRKKLARVSAQPGKTATINFYDIDKTLIFVDLPGYGFAKARESRRRKTPETLGGSWALASCGGPGEDSAGWPSSSRGAGGRTGGLLFLAVKIVCSPGS